LGVLGLGRRWRTDYKPALNSLGDLFEVRALCDGVYRRAQSEAKQWECYAARGTVELLERDDIDALLLIEGNWLGLWPVEQAGRIGKPVFCATSLATDEACADSLLQSATEAGVPMVIESIPRVAPATIHLRKLLEGDLGEPRFCSWSLVTPVAESSAECRSIASLFGGREVSVVDWCLWNLGHEVLSVSATATANSEFVDVFAEWTRARAAQLVIYRQRGGQERVQATVIAERGKAVITLPNQVRCSTTTGKYTYTIA